MVDGGSGGQCALRATAVAPRNPLRGERRNRL